MKCPNCKKVVKKGIFEHEAIYCNQECADKHWNERGADNWARSQSEGEFENFEDYMESNGAVIADDHCCGGREQ